MFYARQNKPHRLLVTHYSNRWKTDSADTSCEGIHRVTPTSVYDAHGIEEEKKTHQQTPAHCPNIFICTSTPTIVTNHQHTNTKTLNFTHQCTFLYNAFWGATFIVSPSKYLTPQNAFSFIKYFRAKLQLPTQLLGIQPTLLRVPAAILCIFYSTFPMPQIRRM